MNKKMLALCGLKWNPFAPDAPVEALRDRWQAHIDASLSRAPC